MKSKKLTKIITFLGGMALVLGVTNTASAIIMVNPGNADSTSNVVGGNDLALLPGGFQLAYKVGASGGESGSFAGSYVSTLNGDLSGFTITFNGLAGTEIPCPSCTLVVKDGNHTFPRYLYNLDTWDGLEQIVGSDFWPSGGSISHVGIYSNDPSVPPAAVPEPGTIILLGSGLAGLGLWRWKTAKKA